MTGRLGIPAVLAVVAGNMLGSGIFYVPGELAALTGGGWPAVWLWPACGLVILLAALSAAEVAGRVPESGAMVVVLQRAYGPRVGFLKAWADTWIVGPGVVASIALVFGELLGGMVAAPPKALAAAAIVGLTAVHAVGVGWSGRVQTGLTALKLLLVAVLCVGGFLVEAVAAPGSVDGSGAGTGPTGGAGPSPVEVTPAMLGAGLAMVLFCFDGWLDVINVAGEVHDARRTVPRGLVVGVALIALVYVAMNLAILRVVPQDAIQADAARVPHAFAEGVFGATGSRWITGAMAVCMLGALGGVLLTLPRVVRAGARLVLSDRFARGPLHALGAVQEAASGTVPRPALFLSAALALLALTTLSTFEDLLAFMTATMAGFVALLVAAVFVLRHRHGAPTGFRVPGYPWLPALASLGVATFAGLVTVQDPAHALLGLGWLGIGGGVAAWLRVGATPPGPEPDGNPGP